MSVMKSTTVTCNWTGETIGPGENERQRDRDGDEAETDHEAPRGVLSQRKGGQGETPGAHEKRHDGEHGDRSGRTCAQEALRTHYPDTRRVIDCP
jgi:hypothetical protein